MARRYLRLFLPTACSASGEEVAHILETVHNVGGTLTVVALVVRCSTPKTLRYDPLPSSFLSGASISAKEQSPRASVRPDCHIGAAK